MKKIYFVLFCLFCGLNLAAQTLPKVTVEDMEGNQIETDSLINGKPFILSFWGVTCKPCLTELNALNEVMDEWREEVDFNIVAVSIGDNRFTSRARSMAQGFDWQFTCIFDKNQDLKRALNVSFTPHTFIIDGEGKIVYSHSGYVPGSETELFDKLKELQNK